eukprot:190878_1
MSGFVISFEEYDAIKTICDAVYGFLPNNQAEESLFNILCETMHQEHQIIGLSQSSPKQKRCDNSFVLIHSPIITYSHYASNNLQPFEQELVAAQLLQFGYLEDVAKQRLEMIQGLEQQMLSLMHRCQTYYLQVMRERHDKLHCELENVRLRRILMLLGSNEEESHDENQ